MKPFTFTEADVEKGARALHGNWGSRLWDEAGLDAEETKSAQANTCGDVEVVLEALGGEWHDARVVEQRDSAEGLLADIAEAATADGFCGEMPAVIRERLEAWQK